MEKMIKTVLVEDEESSLLLLRNTLQKRCPNIEIVAECKDGPSAVDAVKKRKPDLVFLDIGLGEMSGLQVLDKLSDYRFEIIFVTAQDKYMRDAIDAQAIDYLEKPYREEELVQAVEKVEAKLLEEYPRIEKIMVPTRKGKRFVRFDDIAYCQADDPVSYIFLKNKDKITLTCALGSLNQRLPLDTFFRTHRSYIVNLDFVKMYANDDADLVMENGKRVAIARTRKAAFFNRFY